MVEIAAYYENQEPSLEQRFLDQVDRGLVAITENPNGWPVIAGVDQKKGPSSFSLFHFIQD